MKVGLLLLGSLALVSLQAQAVEPYQEYKKRVESAQTITVLNDQLMGDSVSLYNGATEFSATDIDLPGNDSLPVRLSRRLSIELNPAGNGGGFDSNLGGAGNWDVEVPSISSTYAGSSDWSATRCSVGAAPSIGGFEPTDFWHGNSIHIPGGGDRTMLSLNGQTGVPQPSDGVQRKWTTRERDMFSCIPMQSGLAGEGFLMQTSSGLRYYFDIAVSRYLGYMNRNVEGFPNPFTVSRIKHYLLASKIQDRFGNTVTFQYNADGHPTSITGSDGRLITLTYSGALLTSASANGRSWQYQYGTGVDAGKLTAVVQPDSSKWQYAYTGTLTPNYEPWDGSSNASCGLKPPAILASFGLNIAHPSGAVGSFQFANKRHYRAGLHASECLQRVNSGTTYYILHTPNYFDVMSLQSKALSGPGIAQPMNWSYDYGISNQALWGSSGQAAAYPCTTCATEKVVTVTNPDNTQRKYRYGFLYALNEGRLLGSSVLDAGGVVKRTESTTYMTEAAAAAQSFFPRYGGIINGDDPSTAAVRPVTLQTIVQDGATFASQVNTFDSFARPLSVVKWSNGMATNYSKTDATEYYDDQVKWLLGQVRKVTNANTNVVLSQTDYDPSTAMPLRQYGPGTTTLQGKLQQTLTYNADGTVATVKDGNNNVTTLSNWYRGTPRNIQHANSTTQSAVVNDNGWITATTDENGFSTGYGYDLMGRLASIVYPTGDSTAWNTVTMAFQQINANEHGLPAGHWRHSRYQGNKQINTYYDAMWRPVLEEQLDYANIAGTLSQTVKRYDASGRLAFQSYPTTNVGDFNSITQGSRTSYDALDRVTRVEQDSELGVLASTTEYLAGFKTLATNPRGYKTLALYTAYDQPTYDWPVTINQADSTVDNASTDIVRDVFGKPTAVRRRNADGSLGVWRHYVYDGYQQLCKTIEPETGATVMGYDGAGNLTHSWSGLTLPATNSCNSDEAWQSGRLTWRRYTARNQVDALRFVDGRGDQNITYTPDGLPASITTYNDAGNGAPVVNAYSYNKRRLLTGESTAQTGWYGWGIGYGYDANGSLASQTYPTGLVVNYSPNALGQATAVTSTDGWTYASGVQYYPNGGIKQFTYGNGLTHNMAQNARQLPQRVTDGGNALDHEYTYDSNGNVSAIFDYIIGAPTAQHRYMTYDGLDRLTGAGSAMFGGNDHWHFFTYNALDNLTSWKQAGVKDYAEYVYTNNRLTNIKNSAGATVVGLEYDVQGNLANKNGQAYVFDHGNRLRETTDKEWYRYDGHGRRVMNWRWSESGVLSQYSQSGQLLYDENYRASGRKATEYVYLAGSVITTRARNIDTNAWTVSFQHTDALGSPVAVTSTAGAVTDRTNYEPYGAAINKPAYDGIGYTGHVMDGATGLTYMQQRYYDPAIGRFLSVDPVTAYEKPLTNFNRYVYANNSPYKFTDPDGRDSGAFYTNPQYQMAGPSSWDGIGLIADFIPVIGDAKGVIEAVVDPSLVNIAAAGVGFVPIVGDAAGKAIKNMDNVADAARAADGASGGGRASNKLQADANAAGPHTAIKRDAEGNVTNYATYGTNSNNPTGFQVEKRVDLTGKAHTNPDGKVVPTPHVKEGSDRYVRPATPDEIPRR